MGAKCTGSAALAAAKRAAGFVGRFALAGVSALNQGADPADLPVMGAAVIILTLGAATLAGLLMLSTMAARIDHAERLSRLVRETRRLRSNRAAEQAASVPVRRRH